MLSGVELSALAVLGVVLLLLFLHAWKSLLMTCIRRYRPDVVEKPPVRSADYPKNLSILMELFGAIGRIFGRGGRPQGNVGRKLEPQSIPEASRASATLDVSRDFKFYCRKDSLSNSSVDSALPESVDGSCDALSQHVVIRIESDRNCSSVERKGISDSDSRGIVKEMTGCSEVVYKAYYSEKYFERIEQHFPYDGDAYEKSNLENNAGGSMPGSKIVTRLEKLFVKGEG